MTVENSSLKTVTIAVGNQKGGVGKTSNTINLAAALAERGRRSLIIDLDMTAGATKSLNVPTDGWQGAFELLTGLGEPEDCIIDGSDPEVPLPPGIHLVPSSRKLAELDSYLGENVWINPQDLLLRPIEKLRGRYDYVWFDTPPQMTKTAIPALKAADYAILVSTGDKLSVSALADALKDIFAARTIAKSAIRLLGIVMCTMPNPRTKLAAALSEYVMENCLDDQKARLKFTQEISRSVVVQEAQRAGTSLFQYAPDNQVTDEYRRLALEVEERIRGAGHG